MGKVSGPFSAHRHLRFQRGLSQTTLAQGAFDLATYHVEGTLYDGMRVSPEPDREYLEILLDIGRKEHLKAVRMEAPEENLELMRRLLEAAKHELDKLALPVAPPVAPPAAMPLAA